VLSLDFTGTSSIGGRICTFAIVPFYGQGILNAGFEVYYALSKDHLPNFGDDWEENI